MLTAGVVLLSGKSVRDGKEAETVSSAGTYNLYLNVVTHGGPTNGQVGCQLNLQFEINAMSGGMQTHTYNSSDVINQTDSAKQYRYPTSLGNDIFMVSQVVTITFSNFYNKDASFLSAGIANNESMSKSLTLIAANSSETYLTLDLFYKINFALKLEGGTTGNSSTDIQFENGSFYSYDTFANTSTDITSRLPTREGYTFNGFYTASTGGIQYIDKNGKFLVDRSAIECQDLHAQWTLNSYTLTLNSNGGTIPSTSGWTGSGGSATKTLTYNASYGTLPTPTRTGYTFKGWYTAASGGTKVTSTTKMGASNTTLYAQWTINSYTLTLNANGGSIPVTSGWTGSGGSAKKTLTYNASYGTLPTPTRAGWTFRGWFTAATGGTQVTSTIKIGTSNVTIYAQWIQYILTANANGGTIPSTSGWTGTGGSSTKGVTASTAYGTLPTPTRTGYTFNGWFTAASGGTKVTSSTVMSSSNATIYAQWSANSYVLQANANGGTIPSTSGWTVASGSSYATKSIKFDATYGTLPTPTRTGHTFKGWFTAASGGTKVTSSTVMKSAATVNIFAQWTANNYTITANANGGVISTSSGWTGSGNTATRTISFNSSYGSLPTVSRTGYAFKGWFTAAEGGTQVTTSTKIGASNTTIYAQWLINAYTITANAQGGTIPATDGWTVNSATATKAVTYNVEYGTLPLPSRNGYHFEGWFTSATGGSKVTSASVMPAKDVSIYAHWVDTWANHRSSSLTKDSDEFYLVSSPQDLAYISYNLNFTQGTAFAQRKFKLTQNIDLAGLYWYPIGLSANKFAGTFDGQNFAISNISTFYDGTTTYTNVGLFGMCENATIKNLTISSGEIVGSINVGAIAANAVNSTFDNCQNRANVGIYSGKKAQNIGGIVGSSQDCKFINCKNYGEVSSSYTSGGILGWESSSGTKTIIENCENHGAISSPNGGNVGGMVGGGYVKLIKNCINLAPITGINRYVGGIIGGSSRGNVITIDHCRNESNITGSYDYVGGIAGFVDNGSKILFSNNSGLVNGKNFVGGIAGAVYSVTDNPNKTIVDNCHSEARVSGEKYVGGIVGTMQQGAITQNCVNNGEVIGASVDIGGIVGNNNSSSAIGCINMGNVTSNDLNVGGISGYSTFSVIKDCHNFATITGPKYVGGIVGTLNTSSHISECLNRGKLICTGSSNQISAGGIVGYIYQSTGDLPILNCFANCEIEVASVSTPVAGIVGKLGLANMPQSMYIEFCGANITCHSESGALQYAGNFYAKVNSSFIMLVKNSYALASFTSPSGTTKLDKLSELSPDLDGNFGIVPTIQNGMPVPIGIFAATELGTTSNIAQYLQTKYGI